MTAVAVCLALLAQLFLVTGQLMLRRGMRVTPVKIGSIAAGIALLSGWFFLWLGLLGNWELSRLFPFEGLNPVLVVLGALIFLKERISPTGWAGIALISLGVTIVTSS